MRIPGASDWDGETQYWLPVLTEAEARELAAGRVPEWLQESCRAMVEWTLPTRGVSYVGLRESQQHKPAKRRTA